MDVEAPERGKVEYIRTQYFAKRRDDDKIRLPRAELIHRAKNLIGLEDGQAKFEGGSLDGARRELFAATGGFVGLGDDADDGVQFGGGAQAGHGEGRRTHEDDTG
jgi:hypothetical protein